MELTMDEVYGDSSPHLSCYVCGFCIDCGDCKSFGCGLEAKVDKMFRHATDKIMRRYGRLKSERLKKIMGGIDEHS